MKKTFSFLTKEEILMVERNKKENALLIDIIIIANGRWNNKNIHIKIVDKNLRELFSKKIIDTLNINTKIIGREVIIDGKDYKQEFEIDFSSIPLTNVDEYRIFLAGLFFGKGYVNRPDSKYYHMDFRIKNISDAFTIMELLQALEIESKQHIKNGWYYVYIKKHFDISEILKMFGTVTAAGVFDTVQIEKNFMASINQRTAIDISNQIKIAEASNKQCKACKMALERFFKYKLNQKHKIIAELRLKYPEMSLADLAFEYTTEVIDPDAFEARVSRQTISRWLTEIVKEIEKNYET